MHSRSLLTASVGAALLLVLLVLVVAAPATASSAESGELRQPPHPKHADAKGDSGDTYKITENNFSAKQCLWRGVTSKSWMTGGCDTSGVDPVMYTSDGTSVTKHTYDGLDCSGSAISSKTFQCYVCYNYGSSESYEYYCELE